MDEKLDYLIRSLTYKRSSFECDLRKIENCKLPFTEGQINGLTIAISEIYSLIEFKEE